MTTSLTNKTKYWTGDKGFTNEEIRMELYEDFQAVEKEKKRKQIKFGKYIIIIFCIFCFYINLNSIFFSYRQDSKNFLIYHSVSLGINITFFFLHLIKKKYLLFIFMKR
ncbi:hypothetical protein UFOVP615_22 [uncultured Caudovirales phage]|uniref:2TM domain-containing protein n=1 Tax=uncultured Caudovirales phage TaxID=2100421 RepID=A0A6J5N5R2_9CAUD|nr:hypothetical protein UFOVP615_22 [uncultured Caudovirales phage]